MLHRQIIVISCNKLKGEINFKKKFYLSLIYTVYYKKIYFFFFFTKINIIKLKIKYIITHS